jgi:tripartite-type tricarboxylate transporter receptor subunit TctC
MSIRMSTRRQTLQALAAGAALPALFASTAARAQQPPLVRQLTLVVAFPPGGATDQVARLLAEGLRGKFAETVIVDNRAGASGRIGTAFVKSGPADGSMLLFGPSFPLAIFPHIYKNLPYDALTDFVPVATTSKGAFALSVGPGVPATVKTLTDFVAWCKAHPDQATFGAPTGSGQHFSGVLFARAADIPLRVVSYKGGAPSVVDALGGHIAAVINPLSEVIEQTRAGKLRMLATTTTQRTRFTPEVPTMKELGYDVIFQDWSGLVGPAKLPKDVVARINAHVAEILKTPEVAARMVDIGTEVDINTPEQFAALYRATWERYRDVVKLTGFTAED